MKWEYIIMLTTSLGGLGGIGTFILLPRHIKKLRAEEGLTESESERTESESERAKSEATQVLTSAAVAMLEPYRQSMAHLKEELAGTQAEVKSLRHQIHQMSEDVERRREQDEILERQRRAQLRIHERWDQDVLEQIKAFGTELPGPPPLYPDSHVA